MSLEPEFALDPDLVYLNHAGIAPWPRRTAEAVRAFSEDNVLQGARHAARWQQVEQRLRERLQRLINAPSADDIALLKSTSEGLSVVAHGLDWHPGDNVVIASSEFPSNRIVWESLQRYGVETRQADLASESTPELALQELCDERTRVMSVSGVQYASGLRMDLQRLGEFCRDEQILFCVDAIQWLGALPFDAQRMHADFVAADGHKWMLGPEGIALFYVKPELRDELRLNQYGWHMVQHMGDFDRRDWRPAPSARRFECGSANNLGIHGLEASLSLLEDIGMESVSQLVLERSTYLLEYIDQHPDLERLTPNARERYAGIVTFRHRHIESERLYRHLLDHGVICAHRGGVRFSPHFYLTIEQLDRALELVLAAA